MKRITQCSGDSERENTAQTLWGLVFEHLVLDVCPIFSLSSLSEIYCIK